MDASLPTGTPDDWWEQAEEIMESEAAERTLGDWYITMVRTAGDTKPNYRISTPSRPANRDKKQKLAASQHFERVSPRVRCLIRSAAPEPAWREADYVLADLRMLDAKHGSDQRVPWARKKSGRWHCLADGRRTVNDHVMAQLHPVPATFTTTENLI